MRDLVSKTKVSLIVAIIFIMSSECAYAQMISFCYKGAWSDWNPDPNLYSSKESILREFNFWEGKIHCTPDYRSISLEKNGVTYFKVTIDYGIKIPPKKVRKEHLKTGEWYVYSGTVEYYVNDTYPTAQEIARRNWLPKPNPRTDITPFVKRTCTDAVIKIQPYKKRPECYNIWFDGIGVAIDIKCFNL